MEDKHIYSTSFLSKLQDRVSEFIEENKNIIQSILPKRRSKESPTVPMEPLKKVIPQTPVVTTTTPEEKKEKPKIKKQKIMSVKKEKVKKFHYRKVADEHVQKTLVASLAIAIISIFGVGAYLAYKDNLYPKQTLQESRQNLSNPKLNTTTDWESYKNDKLGFSIKYPTNYTINKLSDEQINICHTNSNEEACLTLTLLTNSLDSFIYNTTAPNKTTLREEVTTTNLGTNKVKNFIITSFAGPNEINIQYYLFDSEEKNTILASYYNPPNKTLNQILSTFKFLD